MELWLRLSDLGRQFNNLASLYPSKLDPFWSSGLGTNRKEKLFNSSVESFLRWNAMEQAYQNNNFSGEQNCVGLESHIQCFFVIVYFLFASVCHEIVCVKFNL